MPEVVLRLQKIMQEKDTNAKDIAQIIEMEPILAGKILKLSNSTYYSRSTTPIKTLPVAVMKIGFKMMMKLVYSLKLTKVFTDTTILDIRQFWYHSLAVAIFTQALSNRVKISAREQDVAYLAGLMHDVGIIVFGYLIPEEYGDFISNELNEDEPVEVQEMKIFGIEHAELGALFIEKWWQIDDDIIKAVKQHHQPIIGGKKGLKCEQLVHVSNGICNNQGITNGIDCYKEMFKDNTWEELQLSLADVDDILLDASASFEQALELMAYS